MLVLTRKQNEKIRIGDQITITVLRMKGKAVRLGIEAPSDVGVMRGELVFDVSDTMEKDEIPVEAESPGQGRSLASKTKKRPRQSPPNDPGKSARWPVEQKATESSTSPLAPFAVRHNPLKELADLKG